MSDSTHDALLARVRDGDLRLHELEDHADAETAAAVRRQVVESRSGADLDAVGEYGFDAAAAAPNIDNMIGGAEAPLAVPGPVDRAVVEVDGTL